MALDEALLRDTLAWAHAEWLKKKAGEPSEWDQGTWLGSEHREMVKRIAYSNEKWIDWDEAEEKVKPLGLSMQCGTACCIAGRVVLTNGWKPVDEDRVVKGDQIRSVDRVASELLGFERYSGVEALFEGDNTIYDLYRIAGDMTDGRIDIPDDVQAAFESGEVVSNYNPDVYYGEDEEW